MKKTILLLLALGGCAADVQKDAETAFAKYQGRPIGSIVAVWGQPVGQGANENGPVFTFAGSSASQAISTSDTSGTVGMAPFSMSTTTATPITISCKVIVFTDKSARVIGMRNDGARGACSDMYRRL